jgi:hypothetical protein
LLIAYVAFFHILGVPLLRHASSSASIVTSLSVWVVLILVVPNLSPFLASRLSPVPSRIKTAREISRLTDVERDALGNRLQQERLAALAREFPVLAQPLPSEAETKARAERPGVPSRDRGLEARGLGGFGTGRSDSERQG